MSILPLPPQNLLKHLFSYNAENGVLLWKNPTSRSMKPGDIAGTLHSKGYIIVSVAGKGYRAHRLIWMMQYGIDPIDQLDHINNNRSDNCLVNLRDVTNSVNQRNKSIAKNNTSGTIGVHDRNNGRPKPWQARISNNEGKQITKCFVTEAEAIEQRKSWKIEFNYIGA